LFSFILIFILLYAILQKSKVLGGRVWIDITISLVLSLVAMFSGSVFDVINIATPWFVLLMVMLVFLALVASFAFKGGVTEMPMFKIFALWLPLIIIVWSMTAVFGPILTPYSAGANSEWEALRTIFHPRIIGAIVMVVIVLFTVKVVVQNK
jgi:hypothetical protein